MRVFFMTGASIGVVGTLAGFMLGVLFVENIETIRQFVGWLIGVDMFSSELYYLTEMPAKMDWREVLQVVFMALALSMLATIYPLGVRPKWIRLKPFAMNRTKPDR